MEMRSGRVVGGVPLNIDLPEGCEANVLSLTTPQDVCRLSAVSPIFKSAAESDDVWQRFLPNDLESILSTALDGSLLLSSASSKKKSTSVSVTIPSLLTMGESFSLEKKSGKICYVLSARDLVITWGDTPRNVTCFIQVISWLFNDNGLYTDLQKWLSLLMCVCLKSVAKSILVCCPQQHYATLYTAYLVFKFASRIYGLDNQPIDVIMKLDEGECGAQTVSWNAHRRFRSRTSVTVRGRVHYPKERGDEWLEMELGDFFSMQGKDGELEIRLFDDSGHWKRGLIVEGIEIRPKDVSRAASRPSS